MKKAFAMNFYILRHSGYFYMVMSMLLIFLFLSFVAGYSIHSNYFRSGFSDAALHDIFGALRLFSSIGIVFVTASFYLLPMLGTNIEGGRRASMAVLLASLPVNRHEFAVSRMIYAGVSSMILVLLAVAALAAGFAYNGGIQLSDVRTIIASWLVMLIPAINIAGVLSTALYLAVKRFLFPVFAVFIFIYVMIMLFTPGLLFGLISSRFFEPVFAALVLLINVLIGIAGVGAYSKRDI